MENYLFARDGKYFVPTPITRGPWMDTATHGGPPCALLAHAIESQRGDPDLFVSRITIDLFRPIPIKPLELKTNLAREGKRIKLVDAYIVADGVEVARASGLMLRKNPGMSGETTLSASRSIPPWESVPIKHFIDEPLEGVERYHAVMQVRRIDPPHQGASMAAWIRLPVTLMPETPLTPLERVGGLADFSSAMGMMSRGVRASFINADISIALHREPEGEWICLESAGRGDHDGISSSSVHLHDSRGLFGHAFANGMSNELPRQILAKG